jgi:hypothetical protein
LVLSLSVRIRSAGEFAAREAAAQRLREYNFVRALVFTRFSSIFRFAYIVADRPRSVCVTFDASVGRTWEIHVSFLLFAMVRVSPGGTEKTGAGQCF